ncbi:MAG: LysR family transcriptional regulator, partial [Planctomycetaceae bacterium]|nr:LysR family transcriptional regulator [Planctomycetaceae bacterium]
MARTYRYKAMQLAQLRGFCIAARERNFTVAARQLGLSASTVWEQLRALERMLGCTLLRREGRAIALTPEGQVLLDIVQPHVEAIDSLKRLFDAGRAQLAPQLVIASSQYLLRFHLPRPIQEFTSAFPKVHLNIQLPTSQQLVSVVEQRVADIAICAFEPEVPRSDVLQYEPILELPLQMLVSKKHPLARKKSVGLAELLEHPVILPAVGTITRRLIDRLLVRHNLTGRLQVIMETPMFDTTQQYVELGIGVGL